MKLLFCEACGDIVAPGRGAGVARFCACGRHAVWWRDPARGELSVLDKGRSMGTYKDEGGEEHLVLVSSTWQPAAYVIGLHNSWLQHPLSTLSAEDYRVIIEDTPDTYLFKKLGTVAIRIRPGHSNDTKYDELP